MIFLYKYDNFCMFFLETLVFKLKLGILRSELSQANADSIKASIILAREIVRNGIDEKSWPKYSV